jgi:lipoprotein-anchoring transpeptidase ErfK/SrfK
MPSHGCVRMKDSDVARLWSLLAVGTPLTIR